MLAIETFIQNSFASVGGKVCEVARLVALVSIATSFDLEPCNAGNFFLGPVSPSVSEPVLGQDDDEAKQVESWHQHEG